jgi:hypothetical protein
LIGTTVIVNVCGADVSMPPFSLPPSSFRRIVTVTTPVMSFAGA